MTVTGGEMELKWRIQIIKYSYSVFTMYVNYYSFEFNFRGFCLISQKYAFSENIAYNFKSTFQEILQVVVA